jgi:SAM-dependent methyltransferase
MISWLRFKKQFTAFKGKNDHRFEINWKDRYPCLHDNTKISEFDTHYIYHPAWAARMIMHEHPSLHIDISSSLSFCSILSASIPVIFYDFRPARLILSNLRCESADITCLPFQDDSIDSLSCMHVVEHIGLGRYGDPIDPDGDLKAISELKRVLKPGGNLFFVVPVGKPMIRFNAHRIYSYDQISQYFSSLSIKQFSLINDNGDFLIDAGPDYANRQNYGCGCWWFTKE